MSDSQRTVQLPADASYLSQFPIQWWYWSGHLQGPEALYGFELVFFATTVPDEVSYTQTVNFGFTEIAAKPSFVYSLGTQAGAPEYIPGAYALLVKEAQGVFSADGSGDGTAKLHAQQPPGGVELELEVQPGPAVLHFGGKLKTFSFGGNTYYYSRESQSAKGILTIGGKQVPVHGTVWFDRQFGDLGPVLSQRYEWLGLQLPDTQILLCDFYDSQDPANSFGDVFSGGTRTDLTAADFEVVSQGWWTSPKSGCRYPLGWNVTVAKPRPLRLTVEPVMEEQELVGSTAYWEGDCTVSGDLSGQAYAEIHGVCGSKAELLYRPFPLIHGRSSAGNKPRRKVPKR